VLYGPGTAAIALTVSAVDLEKIYGESGGENVILNLIIENGGTHNRTAMFKEVQTSPLTREYLHVDFYEISLEKEITVKVQVEPVGKCKGTESGGFLQLIRHELDVSCLPGDIPSKIEVDVSHLDIGDSLHVQEIDVGAKVKLLYDSNFTVVTVAAPTVEEEAVAEEELEEAEEIPAEAEAEEETANK
jgi:large subunit ribosomal protein L25